MVGAGEQKLCPAGDGAEFPNHKFVMVDRIVVQHIVLFKLPRVMDEVVIHGKIPDHDVGMIDDTFQSNKPSHGRLCADTSFLRSWFFLSFDVFPASIIPPNQTLFHPPDDTESIGI